MTSIKPQPGIMNIQPYKGGKSQIDGVEKVVKLSSNENPFGPSDRARKAFARSEHQLHRYPSTDHANLRRAIAGTLGLRFDNIICGAGSDEIITFLCQAYAGPGDEVVHTEHGFSMYRISTLAAGATPVETPERDRVVDVDTILAASGEKTKLVFIANPANPTGTMVDSNAIKRLAEGLPDHTLLVLDGAYAEYVDGFDGGAALVEKRQNVFMTRTFSKLHGVGGLRIGWGYGPAQVIDVLNRVRGPFNLSEAQLQTAEAAIRDVANSEKCRAENTRLRAWLAKALANIGVASDDSYANFILARFKDQTEAEACDRYLNTRGIIVRRVTGYKLPNCLRITIGDESACRQVVDAICAFKEGEK